MKGTNDNRPDFRQMIEDSKKHDFNVVLVYKFDRFSRNKNETTKHKKTLKDNGVKVVSATEYTHYAEGTKEYVKLVNYLQAASKLLDKAFTSFVNRGYANADMIKTINEKQARGETPTEQETTYMASLFSSRTFQSEMGAIMGESLLGTEEFIDTIVSKENSIAEKVMKKIKDLKAMFERLGNTEARAEYKRLSKAEKLYLNAIEKAGYIYRNGKILVRRKKEEIDSTYQNEYNSDEIQSSRKFSFQHQNFPGEKESGGSEAHRLAIWWASKDTILAGDQTLISMKDKWYLVEKFDDVTNHYQVEDRITKKEYDKINEEIKANGRSGKILSIQRAFTNYDKFDKFNYSIKGRKSSIDSLQTQYDRENSQFFRVDKEQSQKWGTTSNRSGDSESGSSNRQGTQYSLKDSLGNELSQDYLKPTSDEDIRYSKKITKCMSDSERYNVLKDRVIENVPTAKELLSDVAKEIGRLKSSEKRALIKKILEEFGVFDKQFYNADIQLTFNYSKNNFREIYNKQQRRYVRFAKMFSVFDRLIENAVGIEVHNRNEIEYKTDKTLKQVYVLVSAFNDSENIVPVKLEIKEFVDKPNSLYVAVALENIKREGVSELRGANGVAQQVSIPSTTISISDLFRKINPNEKDFTKYIPPQFFESDIQYSRKSSAPSKVGDIIKAKGNLTTDKIFTKAEAKKIIADIEERLVFEDKGMVGTVKGTNELIDRLWKGLNKAGKGEYIGVGVEIADYVINHTVVEDIYECLCVRLGITRPKCTTRLTADQKYLMLAYLGYSTNMERVERYVNRLRLTKDEKKALLKECA